MKKIKIANLGLWGGSPMFQNILHVGRPNIGNSGSFIKRLNDIFDRHWLTNNGPYVRELENVLAQYLGVKHCISICNATVALEISARTLELKGEVILPSFTFVATAHALQWLGIKPVFCDVNPFTHNVDFKKIERLITSQTTGILGVHVWGRAGEVDKLTTIAKKHNLKLMFDAAHAFACSYKDQMVGNFGDLEVFSFHATKFFNTFEGGAITTNNDELADKARRLRNFGFSGMDNVVELGINGKMTEVSAAMGLTSFESLDEFIKINYRNYQAYQKGLAGIPGVKMIRYDESEKNNYQYIVIEIDSDVAGIDRDLMVKILHAENILARRYFYPGCHQMEPYRTLYKTSLPYTEDLASKVIQLPTGTSVNEHDIDIICSLLRFIVENSKQILKSK